MLQFTIGTPNNQHPKKLTCIKDSEYGNPPGPLPKSNHHLKVSQKYMQPGFGTLKVDNPLPGNTDTQWKPCSLPLGMIRMDGHPLPKTQKTATKVKNAVCLLDSNGPKIHHLVGGKKKESTRPSLHMLKTRQQMYFDTSSILFNMSNMTSTFCSSPLVWHVQNICLSFSWLMGFYLCVTGV